MEEREGLANADELLAEMYQAYFRDVYVFVYRRIGNQQVAEDIAQDVFYTALSKKEEFLRHPKPKGWLMVTARNKMRELKRKLRHEDPSSLEELPETASDEADYKEIELEMAALKVIDAEEWELVKDYYLRGITTKELAGKYGITENNMRVRLHRLKAKMRSKIDR